MAKTTASFMARNFEEGEKDGDAKENLQSDSKPPARTCRCSVDSFLELSSEKWQRMFEKKREEETTAVKT